MRIAGVMSGSSLDGVDVAIVDFVSLSEWEVFSCHLIPYSPEWVDRLRRYYELSARDYIAFQYAYSYYLADLLNPVIRGKSINLLSVHGHTLLHDPKRGFSEQIGNGAIISAKTGVPCVTDFRNGDMALGGQGTPLAPIVDQILYSGHDYYLNLGGIANITIIKEKNISAYDICPCNQVLNHFSQKLGHEYDKDGNLSRSGQRVDALITYFDSWTYFSSPPPKSLDNNWIREQFIAGIPGAAEIDVLHSLTIWMADAIAGQINHMHRMAQSLLPTGGGTHNHFLMELLFERLAARGCEMVVPDAEVIDFKEAVLMALLGHLYIIDQRNVLASVTGAMRNSIGGALYKC